MKKTTTKDWEIKTLGEVCNFHNGLWKGKKPPYETVSVIRNTNFTKDGHLDDSDIAVLDVEEKQFSKRQLAYGDIVLEKSGGGPKQPVGRVIIFDKKEGKYSFSNFTSVIRINSDSQLNFIYLHRFLYFLYISGYTEKLQNHTTGIRNLDFAEYKNTKIPLPPLPEQKRIVKILDEKFVRIDELQKITEQQIVDAKELFESCLSEIILSKDSVDWITAPIGEVSDLKQGLAINAKTDYLIDPNGSLPLLRIKDLKHKTAEIFIDAAKASKAVHVYPEDIIYSRTGQVGLVFKGFKGILHNNSFKVTPVKNVSRDYLFWYLQSKIFFDQVTHFAKRAAQPDISHKSFKTILFSYPKSIARQNKIAKELDQLSVKTKELETIFHQKIADLEELKKSYLADAFAGKL